MQCYKRVALPFPLSITLHCPPPLPKRDTSVVSPVTSLLEPDDRYTVSLCLQVHTHVYTPSFSFLASSINRLFLLWPPRGLKSCREGGKIHPDLKSDLSFKFQIRPSIYWREGTQTKNLYSVLPPSQHMIHSDQTHLHPGEVPLMVITYGLDALWTRDNHVPVGVFDPSIEERFLPFWFEDLNAHVVVVAASFLIGVSVEEAEGL